MARTWILTGSPENHAATAAREYSLIGLKERNRNRALEIGPGDRIVLYLTRVKAFAGSIRIEGEHVGKWPREHWTLAFQGQIRPVSERDVTVLMQRLGARAGAAA